MRFGISITAATSCAFIRGNHHLELTEAIALRWYLWRAVHDCLQLHKHPKQMGNRTRSMPLRLRSDDWKCGDSPMRGKSAPASDSSRHLNGSHPLFARHAIYDHNNSKVYNREDCAHQHVAIWHSGMSKRSKACERCWKRKQRVSACILAW